MTNRVVEWWGRRSIHAQSLLIAFAIYLTWGVIDGLFTYHGMMTHGVSWELNPRIRRLFQQDPELVLRMKLVGSIRHAASIFLALEAAHYLVPLVGMFDNEMVDRGAHWLKKGVWGISYAMVFLGLALSYMHVWVFLT